MRCIRSRSTRLDVRDFTLTTFGGSGSLLLCRLIDVLGFPTVLVPPNPATSRPSGCSPSTSRTTTCRPTSRSPTPSTRRPSRQRSTIAGQAAALTTEGFAPEHHQFVTHRRPALLRPGLRGSRRRCPTGRSTPPCSAEVATSSTPSTAPSTATTSRPTPTSRSSGSTCGSPASGRSSGEIRRDPRRVDLRGHPRPTTASNRHAGSVRRGRRVRRHARGPSAPTWPPGTVFDGPGDHRGVRLDGAAPPRLPVGVDEYLNLIVTRSERMTDAGGGPHQFPYGDLPPTPARAPTRCWSRSSKARSPASRSRSRPRSAHRPLPDDPRGARLPRRIHDRLLRKLTGRSYSASSTRSSATSRSRRCARATSSSTTTSTAPRAASATSPISAAPSRSSHEGEVVAFVQAFGHHDDIGGAVPGSMPSHGTTAYQEGLIIPPVGSGRRRAQPEALTIMARNSRMPDSLRRPRRRVLGLPDGREQSPSSSAATASAVESCFDAILDRTTETFRREILARSPSAPRSGRITPSTTASTRRAAHPAD